MTTRGPQVPRDIEERPPYAQRLIRARVAKGWTQEQLQKELGINDRTQVARWERKESGVEPNDESARRLAKVLGGDAREFRLQPGEPGAPPINGEDLSAQISAVLAAVEALHAEIRELRALAEELRGDPPQESSGGHPRR